MPTPQSASDHRPPAIPQSIIWRLLITDAASGSGNMAVDEAIATFAARGESPATLRFYQWQPGTVSLGRHQSLADLDMERVQQLGYGVVRRATGGRAILHIDELTYSISGTANDAGLGGAVLDSYNQLSSGLMLGLQRLGIDAVKAPAGNRAGADASPVCFEVPSAYEITAGGRKLLGSAQSRRSGYVLQHGSLPLTGDVARLVDVLAVEDESQRADLRRALAERATTLEMLMGRYVSFWEAATVLIDGLSSALGVDFTEGELSSGELALAAELEAEKYAEANWLLRI